jgi:type I restriction-modification system DNA methylase subunit
MDQTLNFFAEPETAYGAIYGSLSKVRDLFHKEGRVPDSNAKLDETLKLLAVHFAARNWSDLTPLYDRISTKSGFSVSLLNELFREVARRPPFLTATNGSVFGGQESTAFSSEEERNVAFALFDLAGTAFRLQTEASSSIDVLNEAFGHFIRDNFRSHIEDAQYMTPPEVVEFMVQLALSVIAGEARPPSQQLFMCDPTCGVGSFILAWQRAYAAYAASASDAPLPVCFGQDKVERMVRLSSANLIFAGNTTDRISLGNSLSSGSDLARLNGHVDLILTNPPFGARFDINDIAAAGVECLPHFAGVAIGARAVDSEILFIDRYIALLKEGGLCLAVVPDGVVSARGNASYIRQILAKTAELKAVVELPPSTFAQAGTRTKTAILMFQRSSQPRKKYDVFFAEANDLGFDVVKRKGATVKNYQGHNQLHDILTAYVERSDRLADTKGRSLIAQWRSIDPRDYDAWTPRRFSMKTNAGTKSGTTKLVGELVVRGKRKSPRRFWEGCYFISVLHVVGEGVIDLRALMEYKPITPGRPVDPGDVLVSRINPRIPRVLVVPDLGKPMLCSSEFEVLRPLPGVSPYALAYLLLGEQAQDQILSMTAGTSASHSRIKPGALLNVVIPWPTDARQRQEFDATVATYELALTELLCALRTIRQLDDKRQVAQ